MTVIKLDHSKSIAENKELLKDAQLGDIAEGHYQWIKLGHDEWRQINGK